MEITRTNETPLEPLTLERGATSRKVRGVASVFYNPKDKGTEFQLASNVVERIAPNAFDHLLNDDCIACVNHDKKEIVGRNNKTLKLWTTARGLEYEVDLVNTRAANDLWENVQAGNIVGSSFKAEVDLGKKENVSWSKEGNTNVLTIKRFDRLKDVSPVSEPAYSSCSVEAIQRSLEDWEADEATKIRLESFKKIKDQMNK